MTLYCDNCGEETSRLYPEGDSFVCGDCRGSHEQPKTYQASLPYIIEQELLR